MEQPKSPRARAGPSLSIIELPCPVCLETLRHRVLHAKVGSGAGGAKDSSGKAPKGEGAARARGPLEGVARCLQCRTTHPFSVSPRALEPVWVVVSLGPRSERHQVQLPPERTLELGETLRVAGRPVRLTRLEGSQGRNLARGQPGDLVTAWAVLDDEISMRVSVIQGARTIPVHMTVRADGQLRVGEEYRVEGSETFRITALRGRGRTWHEEGDTLPNREVQRIYARWARTPPGGKRSWTRSRETPRSWAT